MVLWEGINPSLSYLFNNAHLPKWLTASEGKNIDAIWKPVFFPSIANSFGGGRDFQWEMIREKDNTYTVPQMWWRVRFSMENCRGER